MDEDRKSARLKIINDQLYNAILNIVAIVILIVIILDQKEKANGN